MSTPFDLMTPAKAGFLGIAADKSLPKKQRAEALAGAVLAYPEKHKGRRNFEVAFDSDPANGLILPSDPAKNAPRGSSASWTFAVPATREGGQWRPLQTLKLGDKDFLKVAAKVLGPRDAVLLETTGHDDHETVALMGGGNLVSHHLNSPPPESSLVHDVDAEGQPDQERKGGIHYTVRVRKMPRQFCLGGANNDKSTAPPEPGKAQPANYAPMLNMTRNGDGTRADGIMHFAQFEAVGSHEAFGFMRPSAPKHKVGVGETEIRQLAFDIDRGVFGDGSDPWSAPFAWQRNAWQRGSRGPFIRDVETRMDFASVHATLCGMAQGVWREMSWKDKTTPTETPPPPKKPVTGPPDDPIFPPPGRPTFPKPDPVDPKDRIKLPAVTERPTRSGPAEEEQPSTRHVIFPNGPDAPKGVGPIAFDIFGNGDKGWREAYGITQREFWGAIRASHDVAHGVHTANTPALSGERWPLTKYKPSVFRQDGEGEFYGKRGHGPAKQTLMPGGLEGHLAFKARNENLLPSGYVPTLTRLLLNYKHSGDSREVRTYFAMGAEIPNSVLPASGVYFKLDYTDGHDVPDLDIRFTDSSGLDNGTGRVVKINGNALPTATNILTAAAVLADKAVVVGAAADRTTVKSDFTMTHDGTNVLSVASGSAIDVDAKNLTNIGTISRGGALLQKQQVRAYAGSGTAVSAATWTQVAFGSETFDVDGVFASDTFTASVACKLRVTAQVTTDIGFAATYLPDPDNNAISIAIYKNGSLFSEGHAVQVFISGKVYVAGYVSDELTLAVNDTVKIYFYSVAGCATGGKGSGVDYATFERVD